MICAETEQSDRGVSKTNEEEFKLEQNIGSNNGTIQFATMATFYARLSALRGGKKSRYVVQFLKVLFDRNRTPCFTYSILRLILPAEDTDRGNYGIKEKALAKIITEALGLKKEEYERLYHYKNPSYHKIVVGIGDFSICLYDVVLPYLKKTSSLTVEELNNLLDELTTPTSNQTNIFRDLLRRCNAEELKWIARIILKDLKLGIKTDVVLKTFHPEAGDYYNMTNSISETCKKLQSLKVSLNDQVELFHSIRPMLSSKKLLKYFEKQTRMFMVETKYDGERIQVHLDRQRVKLFTRNAVDYSQTYSGMIPILRRCVQVQACILDGEMIVINSSDHKMKKFGYNKLIALIETGMQICYKIFDLLWLKEGNEQLNMMSYPLRERKKILERIINEETGSVELVQYKELFEYRDIFEEFDKSMLRNEEGIILKDPNSIYVPKERAQNWIKLKPDYIDNLADTLDLVIIGGYFGDLSFRLGTQDSHWTNHVTSFLVGVVDNSTESSVGAVLPFARVGQGFNEEQLNQLRAKLRNHLILTGQQFNPPYITCNWKYSTENKPVCYIDALINSVVLEVKAAEIADSTNFATDCTLRNARTVSIRYDKDWHQAMTKDELVNMRNEIQYTKSLQRKRNDNDTDSDREKETKNERTKKTNDGRKVKTSITVLPMMMAVDVTEERLQSYLFSGIQFCVQQQHEGYAHRKHEIEKVILLHGGTIVQNPIINTRYIISEEMNFKVYSYLASGRPYIFIKPKYVFNCIRTKKILPLSPLYLTCLPNNNADYYKNNFDKFCDSYTSYLDLLELDEILATMKNDHPLNARLDHALSFQIRRRTKTSLCFGVDELSIIKLKMRGHCIVDSLEQTTDLIVFGQNVTEEQLGTIEAYQETHEYLQVEQLQELLGKDG